MSVQFKEIERININENRDIMISEVVEDGKLKGYNIGSYIRTAKYTGPAKGGTFIPADKYEDFQDMIQGVALKITI